MATPVEASTAAVLTRPSRSAVYLHGAVAGLIGAATLAAWFFYLDVGHGRPLYTPTVLGTLLFRRSGTSTGLHELSASIPMTLVFTVVHGLVFAIIGVTAARLLGMVQPRPRLPLAILLAFIVLEAAFVAFALTGAAVAFEVLEWPNVVLGNLLAATAMITYLWRRRPGRSQAGA